ncbi:MAG: hypothetical protein MZU97_08065 [Bacillus subtilis]|nr:hypothetical protein [Bacillus subtilis]
MKDAAGGPGRDPGPGERAARPSRSASPRRSGPGSTAPRRSTSSRSRSRRSTRSWARRATTGEQAELEKQILAKSPARGGGRQGPEGAEPPCRSSSRCPPRPESSAPIASGWRTCPGRAKTQDNRDLDLARTVLDEDHYGMKKAKERILEFIAVRQLKEQRQGTHPLLRRRPGHRQDLPGQIRRPGPGPEFRARYPWAGSATRRRSAGHRKTYVGALPGKIIQSMRKAGSVQPRVPPGRDRQDVQRLPGRPGQRPPGGPGSGTELHLHRTITWRCPTTSPGSCSSPPPTPLHNIPYPLLRPDGGDRDPGLQRVREAGDRPALHHPQAVGGERP